MFGSRCDLGRFLPETHEQKTLDALASSNLFSAIRNAEHQYRLLPRFSPASENDDLLPEVLALTAIRSRSVHRVTAERGIATVVLSEPDRSNLRLIGRNFDYDDLWERIYADERTGQPACASVRYIDEHGNEIRLNIPPKPDGLPRATEVTAWLQDGIAIGVTSTDAINFLETHVFANRYRVQGTLKPRPAPNYYSLHPSLVSIGYLLPLRSSTDPENQAAECKVSITVAYDVRRRVVFRRAGYICAASS